MPLPKHFTLICETREDGGLRVYSYDVLGLILSGPDPRAVLRDIVPAIEALSYHNARCGECGYPRGAHPVSPEIQCAKFVETETEK